MVQTLGKERPDAPGRTNWWLIGAVVMGLSFWVVVLTAGRAIIG